VSQSISKFVNWWLSHLVGWGISQLVSSWISESARWIQATHTTLPKWSADTITVLQSEERNFYKNSHIVNIQWLVMGWTARVHIFVRLNPLALLPAPWDRGPSWEANSRSASQEMPRLLCNQNFHYRVHKSPPVVPVLSQTNRVHEFPTYFFNIHFNIILSSTRRSFECSPPFRFSDHNFV